MNWKECIEEKYVKKVEVDVQRSESLKKIANKRMNFINSISKTKENNLFIFESYYTLVIELLHSLAYKKGYKILNHICLGCFLKEYFNINENKFDKFRKQRNNLVYYGFELSQEVIEKNIVEIRVFIKKLKKL